jgi:hypothetical protein
VDRASRQQEGVLVPFQTALDIPEAEPTALRNQAYQGAARDALVIDPGARSVAGRDAGAVTFDGGSFLGVPVYLGELRTDAQGRLLVLGGRGHSFSPHGAELTTFANNDGWTDDTSDGPVSARVRLGGVELPVDPAWVVVAPPNYGPAIATDFGTMYDGGIKAAALVGAPEARLAAWQEEVRDGFASYRAERARRYG